MRTPVTPTEKTILQSMSDTAHGPASEETTPDWLRALLVDMRKVLPPILPDWVRFADLPPLTSGTHRFDDYQVQAVLLALRKSTLDAPMPLLSALKEQVDRAVLDAFVWRLFEQWQKGGANSKDKWALLALGHLGGDGSALKLTPLFAIGRARVCISGPCLAWSVCAPSAPTRP